MKAFLICSVRNASAAQSAAQESYVRHLEDAGWTVHYPPRDTKQDSRGLAICYENMDAIAEADEVHVFYAEESQGIHFDMGVAFALGKLVRIAYCPELTAGKSYARMLREWEEEQIA